MRASAGSTRAPASTSCFYETIAGGYGGRARERRPGRGAGALPEHRERADRGDRAQLPGAHPALRAHRELRGAGPLPRRPRRAADYRFAGHDELLDPLRPRPLRAVGPLRRRDGAARRVRPGSATARRRGSVSKITLQLAPGDVVSVQTCGGGGTARRVERDPERVPARRARGQDLRRARARRLRRGRPDRRDRDGRLDDARDRRNERCAEDDADDRVARGHRHRRHVHRRDADRRGRPAPVAIAKVLVDAGGPGRGLHGSAVERALAECGAEAARRAASSSTRRPWRPTRSSRARSRAAGFVTTEGFRDMLEIGRQIRPDALRRAVREADAARAARPRLERRASGSSRRARCCAPLDDGVGARCGGASLRDARASSRSPSASCTPTSTPRTSGASARSSPRSCPASRSRSRRRSRPSSASTCARRRPSINAAVRPIVDALPRAHRVAARRRRASTAQLLVMQSNGGVFGSEAAARAAGLHGRVRARPRA